MRVFKRAASTATVVFFMSCSAAYASPQQFTFEGVVSKATGIFFDAGSPTISGSFSYDPGLAPFATSATGDAYQSMLVIPGTQLQFNVAGHTASAPIAKINVVSNSAGGDNGVFIDGNFLFKVDGVSSVGGLSLNLYAPKGSTDPFSLPTSFNSPTTPGEFPGGYLTVLSAGGASTGAAFSITSITAVPEPCTNALIVAGLVGLGYATRGEKKAKSSGQ